MNPDGSVSGFFETVTSAVLFFFLAVNGLI